VRNSSCAACAIAFCAAIAIPSARPALAQSTSKTVTWTMKNAPAAGTKNAYYWSLSAFASQPPNPADTEKNPTDGGTGEATWDATMALASTSQTTNTAVSGGASSLISQTFSATAPTAVAGGLFQVQTTLTTNAVLSTPPGGSTSVSGGGGMFVTSGLVTGADITKKGEKVQAVPQAKLGTFAALTLNNGKFADPIDVSLYDASDADALVASQQIGAISMNNNFMGTVEWDSSGLSLSAPIDGQSSSSITADVGDSDGNGDYADSWVTDSYVGYSSVSLSDGTFTATGIFAGLPWQFDNPSSPTEATLAPQYLAELDLDYQISASLVNSNDEYYEQLTSEETLDIEEAVPAPEPATLTGFAAVAAIGLLRRQRPSPRAQQ
jgi:hypothetical protein